MAESLKSESSTRDRVLEAAERLSRRPSSSGFTLEELADGLGVHYTAIYHYFRNKNHLELALIERILNERNSRLRDCQQQGGSVVQQIQRFIAEELNEPPTDVLVRSTELMSEPYRGHADEAVRESRRIIARLLDRGIAEGSIRECDTDVAAELISRLMNRYRNRAEYRRRGDRMLADTGLSPAQVAQQVDDVILYGLLANPGAFDEVVDLEPVPFPRGPAWQTKQASIVRALIPTFNALGYDGTSIPKVAASMGLSKTSFYRYGSSKEELLNLCARHSLELTAQVRQLARVVTADPLITLLYNVYYGRILVTEYPGPTLRTQQFRALSVEHGLVAWEIFFGWRDSLMIELEQAMAAKRLRGVEPALILPFLTIASGTPIRQRPLEDGFGDEVARFLLCGIAAPNSGRSPTKPHRQTHPLKASP